MKMKREGKIKVKKEAKNKDGVEDELAKEESKGDHGEGIEVCDKNGRQVVDGDKEERDGDEKNYQEGEDDDYDEEGEAEKDKDEAQHRDEDYVHVE